MLLVGVWRAEAQQSLINPWSPQWWGGSGTIPFPSVFPWRRGDGQRQDPEDRRLPGLGEGLRGRSQLPARNLSLHHFTYHLLLSLGLIRTAIILLVPGVTCGSLIPASGSFPSLRETACGSLGKTRERKNVGSQFPFLKFLIKYQISRRSKLILNLIMGKSWDL